MFKKIKKTPLETILGLIFSILILAILFFNGLNNTGNPNNLFNVVNIINENNYVEINNNLYYKNLNNINI